MRKWIVAVAVTMACGAAVLTAQTPAFADSNPATFAADKGPAKVDVSSYPAEVQQAYSVFASRCNRCHTLARAINTNLSPDSWKLYVKKMMSKPGSGISPDDGKTIYRFLAFYQNTKDKKGKNASN